MIHIKTGAPLWSNTNWKKAYDWALGQFGIPLLPATMIGILKMNKMPCYSH